MGVLIGVVLTGAKQSQLLLLPTKVELGRKVQSLTHIYMTHTPHQNTKNYCFLKFYAVKPTLKQHTELNEQWPVDNLF